MSIPPSSILSQIAAIERAHDSVPNRRVLTDGQILLEQKYLSDALKTLRVVDQYRDVIVEAIRAEKNRDRGEPWT
jgi:hypothetical protein